MENFVRLSEAAKAVGVAPGLLFEAVELGRVRFVALKGGLRGLRTTEEWVLDWMRREMN
jgi:hypothetical protein